MLESSEINSDLDEITSTLMSTTLAISTATTPSFNFEANKNVSEAQNSSSNGFPVNGLISGQVKSHIL